MKNVFSYRLATFAVILAFAVVMLGAYTRLTHAGLGCPDWPGCYGHMVVPEGQQAVQQANNAFPGVPLQETKAWTEMIHRYLAGFLGLLILGLFITGLVKRRSSNHPVGLPLLLVLLVGLQAALGMWTVTWKLLPTVVMGHLLGGITIFACLALLRLRLKNDPNSLAVNNVSQFRPWVLIGCLIVFCQIALGGWVSSNYAGIACIGFPYCNGQLLPHLNLHAAFNFLTPIGANYQGGVLDSSARVTIQVVHRIGAFVTLFYVGALAIILAFRAQSQKLHNLGMLLAIILVAQFILGIMNVLYLLPLPVAVAHNGVAALLLVTMVSISYYVFAGSRKSGLAA